MSRDDERWLRHAIELAAHGASEDEGGPFGTVIVRDAAVIGEGWNRVTSIPDPTAHAEIEAIRDAAARVGEFHLEGSVVYASAEPCPMCYAALRWAHVDRVVYAAGREVAAAIGFDDALLYADLAHPDDRGLPMEQALAGEATKVMEAWFDRPDRVPY